MKRIRIAFQGALVGAVIVGCIGFHDDIWQSLAAAIGFATAYRWM
jgi:hypothetical protein